MHNYLQIVAAVGKQQKVSIWPQCSVDTKPQAARESGISGKRQDKRRRVLAPANQQRIMVFLHLFIVNRSGGLIHHRSLSSKAPQIGTNEWLRIGSTFHSLHAIAAEASPLRLKNNRNASGADDGIEEIQVRVRV